QAHAKQQKRQIIARQEDNGRENEGAASGVGGWNAAANAFSASLTDGEEAPISLSRQRLVLRDHRRHRRKIRAPENGESCFSDSEVVVCDDNASR
ncbi:unnamed protein product, partial [Ectocarpus sp. 12 AP-2014]